MLERSLRIVTTGCSFLFFGLTGLLGRIFIFPLFKLLIWKKTLRTLLIRHFIRLHFRVFVELMRFFGVLRYTITGLERLERQGLLILANHPTLLDTVFLMAFVKNANCIVRSGLFKNPFTKGPIEAANYISNGEGPQLIEDCIQALRQGDNLIVFPEGTRTPRLGNAVFQRGAANIALRGKQSITPVTIECKPLSLGKGEPWWKVPKTRMHFTLCVEPDIDIRPFISSNGIASRFLTGYLERYFGERIPP